MNEAMYTVCRTLARYKGFVIRDSCCCIVALVVGGIILEGFHPFLMILALRQETLNCRYNRRWSCSGNSCHPLRDSRGQEPCQQPWAKAIVDYSGANQYVEAHYGSHPLLQSSSKTMSSVPYFYRDGAEGDKIREPIYNARELQIIEDGKSLVGTRTTQPASNSIEIGSPYHIKSLEKFGMTLVNSPTRVIDWKNRKDIEDVYIQELENVLPTLFSSKIEVYSFWNPMLRGESHDISPPRKVQDNRDGTECEDDYPIPTANVASAVHIDTDVGAYGSLDEFLAIVEKNEVKRQGSEGEKKFDREQYQTEITKNRKRFAVVNFWRNTNRLVPVTTSPLAILSTRYEDENNTTNSTKTSSDISAFPNSRPNLEQSIWYTFPNMTSDEILVFYQYDRLATQPSDLWHCAISIEDDCSHNTEGITTIDSKGVQVPRESFDIRALVLFDEIVDEDKDRFHPERVRPVLSFEESGCFCDEQAAKRSQ